MKTKTKDKLILWKRYFDTGRGLTNDFKYIVLLFGVFSMSVVETTIFAVIYLILCFFIGWAWLNSDFYTRDIELSNKYNLFVEETRKKLGIPNKEKSI